MTNIEAITLEVADVEAAAKFYANAFGLPEQVRLRATEEPTSGFRGFTLSLLVSQPGNVHALVDALVGAGATTLKPVKKSLWGVGGVVQAPDGTIWKVATSSKKDTAPASTAFDRIVLLLGATDVAATKQFYVDHGLPVAKSFGKKYVEFDTGASAVGMGLYERKALAKDAGVPPEGSGSHRIAVVTDAGAFADPDGFAWEPPASA
ncbi:MAG: glyoxalase [Nocardioidaceae bacterium]|nr:glyoxalase [Nocardioidaceae bacterium]